MENTRRTVHFKATTYIGAFAAALAVFCVQRAELFGTSLRQVFVQFAHKVDNDELSFQEAIAYLLVGAILCQLFILAGADL